MAALTPYPLRCEPLPKQKVWGGRRLTELFGKLPAPGASNIGETWEIADLPNGTSMVANGLLAGASLTEVVQRVRPVVLGDRAPWKRFPLLVKFIDANDDLSIQVHPDAETSQRHFRDAHSKDESWIVVHAEPGARLLAGVKPGVTREQLEELLWAGQVVDCLHSLPVRKGQVIRIAPGTVHALCRGVVVLEIQEPSDTTFRLYDYDRLDPTTGTVRELHVEQALTALHLTAAQPVPPRPHETDWGLCEDLVTCPAYEIQRWRIENEKPFQWTPKTMLPRVLVCLTGEGAVRGGGETVYTKPGDALVLPAESTCLDLEFTPSTELVLASPGLP